MSHQKYDPRDPYASWGSPPRSLYLARPKEFNWTSRELFISLSNINRFCGHPKSNRSVLDHSLEMADQFFSVIGYPQPSSETLLLHAMALLHDAHESVAADLPRPVKDYLRHKNQLSGYSELCDNIQEAIEEALLWSRLVHKPSPNAIEYLRCQVKDADDCMNRLEWEDYSACRVISDPFTYTDPVMRLEFCISRVNEPLTLSTFQKDPTVGFPGPPLPVESSIVLSEGGRCHPPTDRRKNEALTSVDPLSIRCQE